MHLAALDSLNKLARIAEAAGHGYPHLARAGYLEHGFLPAVHAADGPEGVGIRIFAGDEVVCGAQRRVHNAAGSAEYDGGSGAGTQWTVEVLLGQEHGVDVVGAHHDIQLAGGDDHIHVGIAAGVLHGGQGALALLGYAGHYGYHEYLVGVHAYLLGKVALRNGAEHLLGGFGGGKVIRKLGILGLQKAHPARAAGGKHGPLVLILMGKALYKFTAFFHYGEVGGEVGIEHIVKAHAAEGRSHAPGGGELGIEAVTLCPCGAHRGSHLNYGNDILVVYCVVYPAGVVALPYGGGGAVGYALAAVGTLGILYPAVAGYVNHRPRAGAEQIPYIHGLHLFADLYAAHTHYALVILPYERRGDVGLVYEELLRVMRAAHIEVVGERLERTVAASCAVGAAHVVMGQQQAQIGAARLAHLVAVGEHLHPLRYYVVAGGDQPVVTDKLHAAYTAGRYLVHSLEVAKRGYLDVYRAGGLQYGGPLRHGYRYVVYLEVYHVLFLPPLNIP